METTTDAMNQPPVIQQASSIQIPERIHSLDALRGFDMFWITGGEGLIHTLAIATGWGVFKSMNAQLHHVKWDGFAAYDLIFPLFMFITGVAIPYALMPKIQNGSSKKEIFKKIISRLIILFVFGILYNQFWWNDWATPRIASVLGQIALAYFFAALIFLYTQKLSRIISWVAAILVIYGMIQLLIPVPDFGAGNITQDGSINAFVDQHFLPGLLLGKTYDPEGVLNIFSATSVTLMGVVAGLILRKKESAQYKKFLILLITGIVLVMLSLLFSIYYPIIKRAWTSTYDMHAAGYSFILLSLFYLIIDIWKFQKWSFYFTVIGVNAITVYLGTHVIDFNYASKGLLGGLAMYLGDWGPVLLSLVYLALVWICLYVLYRNKIFLRV